ncbi:multiubiquitin domain-containing protein [Mesorhizobium sp. WSM3876]|uniref:multiubiquitin domain-containing protein n=1 Tax=Mesorhizobium sp. WSM3876 TaxID=422277 RepID=UPI001596C709|nr:multiubiquitin domain-containing protein [Mesorhizobium sp. WSM3876]
MPNGNGHDPGKGGGKPDSFPFFFNGQKYETDQASLTGLQIKAKISGWDQTHDLVLEGHGQDPDKIIQDDELVLIDTKQGGPPRFSSAPKANFG